MNENRHAIRGRYQADLETIKAIHQAASMASLLSFGFLGAGHGMPDIGAPYVPRARPANPRRDKQKAQRVARRIERKHRK